MLYVYRRARSNSARDLAEAINGERYRALRLPMERKVRPGDVVICWGESLVPITGVKILNGAPIQSKFHDALMLREKNVATVTVSKAKPAPTPAGPPPPDPAFKAWEEAVNLAESFVSVDMGPIVTRTDPYKAGVQKLIDSLMGLKTAINVPPPTAPVAVQGEWLPRLSSHVGGNDLMSPPSDPDFWAKKETLVNEYRVHSFLGKSIRAGIKKVADDVRNPHPWIRSYDNGWRISYDGETVRQKHRDIAHAAVKALGLDFGAVDIGERADGSLIVLEVNRAPGLEGGTIPAYANAIQRWLNGE